MPATVGQKDVGTSEVRFTATTGQAINTGIKLSVSTTGKCYYRYETGVTTANGFYINGVAEIHPASCSDPSTIYLISDTASQKVTYEVVGQAINIT